MPLKSKKSPAKKKPQPKSKAVAPKSKPKLQAKSKPKAPNLFRQILAEREKQKEQPPPQQYKWDHRGHHPQQRHEQFAKFAGPRRRAA